MIKAIKSFAEGLKRDIDAVENAVAYDYSNGFLEGTNRRLKMIKRTMYGCCRKQLTAGIVIYMSVNLLMYCNEIIIAIDNGKAFLKTSDFPILIIGIIVNFGPAILYLVGARRNRPAEEQIKVENR